MRITLRFIALTYCLACSGAALHAAVPQLTYVPQPPLRVQGNSLVDST